MPLLPHIEFPLLARGNFPLHLGIPAAITWEFPFALGNFPLHLGISLRFLPLLTFQGQQLLRTRHGGGSTRTTRPDTEDPEKEEEEEVVEMCRKRRDEERGYVIR